MSCLCSPAPRCGRRGRVVLHQNQQDAVEGATPAAVVGTVPNHIRDYVAARFAIGPTVERQFWDGERSTN